MRRHVVRCPQAPETPHASQAISVEFQRLTFVSGQLPIDTTGGVADEIRAQTRQVMVNLRAVLESAGLDLDSIGLMTVYLTHPRDLPQVDAELETCFLRPPPARVVVGVSALPGGARLQIAAIAAG
jgi:2-iminobutanoate/2-iminopropanoate deaminase